MNPFNTAETINFDGIIVRLPVIQNGSTNALSTSITFEEPNWMPDTSANTCLNCNSSFTLLTRRHHCRNCGKIFCNECCSEKMLLPHLGKNELEKVCNNCKLIVELLMKAKSENPVLKQEAIAGVSNLIKNAAGLCKVVENGGIHLVLGMVFEADNALKNEIATVIHTISQNMVLNSYLVEMGVLKVLKHLLVTASCDQYETLSNCLSALNLFCVENEVKVAALQEGLVDPLLTIIGQTGTMAVLSARILQLLLKNFDHHDFILQKHSHIVSTFLTALQIEDHQMQSSITKMLVFLSAGSETFRQLIMQEDASREFPLLLLMRSSMGSALVNVVCIVSNLSLALDEEISGKYICGLCELLEILDEEVPDIRTHIGRGLANLAEYPTNALHLIPYLPTIIKNLLNSDTESHRIHACRILICLYSTESACVLEALSRSGMSHFVETLFELPGITDVFKNLLLRKVSRLSMCQ